MTADEVAAAESGLADLVHSLLQPAFAEAREAQNDAPLSGHIRQLWGDEMGDAVAEGARRRLASALYDQADGKVPPAVAALNVACAASDYAACGGEPATVTGDWVSAWHTMRGWTEVPVDQARWNDELDRYETSWSEHPVP